MLLLGNVQITEDGLMLTVKITYNIAPARHGEIVALQAVVAACGMLPPRVYSTVTDLARLRG